MAKPMPVMISAIRQTITIAGAQALIAAAVAKAFTSAAFRAPTHVLAAGNQNDPTRLASLPNLPRMTLLAGGYPINNGPVVIGGIGVGGGNPQQDMDVAEAALRGIQ